MPLRDNPAVMVTGGSCVVTEKVTQVSHILYFFEC